MPTYTYGCRVCKTEFEADQKISDKAWAECPTCYVMCSNRLIVSGSAFSLSGPGWAKDGYTK